MSDITPVNPAALRDEVKKKYRDVAIKPNDTYHFHTGRRLAARLNYDIAVVDGMPGERVVDLGSGAGFDCFFAAGQVGSAGHVIGVDMTEEMLAKSRNTAQTMGLRNIEFREGILEELPVEDGWADVVISNGVINLCVDKRRVFAEIWRVLKPGGQLQFADIANGKPVPASAVANVDLWTA
jgi:arsenite methyltransferase